MKRDSWSGLTETEQNRWGELFKKYVPEEGMASTIGGEIIRAMSMLTYKCFNDGAMCSHADDTGEWLKNYDRYLNYAVEDYNTMENVFGANYEKRVQANCKRVYKYIMENPTLFKTENPYDSMKCGNVRISDLRQLRITKNI